MSESDPLDFHELFRRWEFEGIESLSPIKGFSELLLTESRHGSLTEDQREIIKRIYHYSLSALDHWRDSLAYLNIQSEKRFPNLMAWKKMSLPELIASAVSILKGYDIGEIRIEIPDSLPPVRVNEWLVRAIASLILPKTRTLSSKYPPLVKGYVTAKNKVGIQISANITEIEAGYIKEDEFNGFLLYPGSRLLTARLVIEKLFESNLEIRMTNTGIESEFTVPVSSLSSDRSLQVLLSTENNGQNIELMLGQQLIVDLPDIDSVECNNEILIEAGGSGRSSASGPKYYEVRFWPMKSGKTPLKIIYHPNESLEHKIFSVVINILP